MVNGSVWRNCQFLRLGLADRQFDVESIQRPAWTKTGAYHRPHPAFCPVCWTDANKCLLGDRNGLILAGLGEALVNPALSASFLDITPEEHRARAMGIKKAIGALGNLSAPALVMLIIHYVPPQSVFLVSAALLLITAVITMAALRLPSRAEVARDLTWVVSQERIMAARSAVHGVALSASTARKLKGAL